MNWGTFCFVLGVCKVFLQFMQKVLGRHWSQCSTNRNSFVINCQTVKDSNFGLQGYIFKVQSKKMLLPSNFFFSMYWFCLVHIKYRKSLELVDMLFRCILAPVCILNTHTGKKWEKSGRSVCAVWQIIGPVALLNWHAVNALVLFKCFKFSRCLKIYFLFKNLLWNQSVPAMLDSQFKNFIPFYHFKVAISLKLLNLCVWLKKQKGNWALYFSFNIFESFKANGSTYF